MDIHLDEAASKLVERQVSSGRFHAADEVVSAALKMLDESEEAKRKELEWLRECAQKGIEQDDAGLSAPLDEVMQRLRSKWEKCVASGEFD